MHQPADDFLKRWEGIVSEVSKTNVPLECVKKVVVKLIEDRQKTINLHTLRRQGLDMEEIEALLSRTLSQLEPQIDDIEFVVDVKSVAELVQPETDRLLGKL